MQHEACRLKSGQPCMNSGRLCRTFPAEENVFEAGSFVAKNG
jgi:hypothetical protein